MIESGGTRVSTASTKAQIRLDMLKTRQNVSPSVREPLSATIGQHLHRTFQKLRPIVDGEGGLRYAALYAAVRGEADVTMIAASLRNDGWKIAFPRVEGDASTLRFVRVDAHTPWCKGRYGIMEPDSNDVVSAHDLAVVVVPGVAFDKRGYRVGYGGGYYDKLFAQPDVHAYRIGAAFSFQVVEDIGAEKHDAPMDWLVTDDAVMDCRVYRAGLREGPS